ncbi:Uma2 family endonuclease [Desulfococcaceae bacterium HSG8]|nr:Uma2 family endonuclease [Desulfococcaceae bacterium HSG8]
MAEMLMKMAESPDFSRIITEDDRPVDNMFSEKQQRLLAESLNTSWEPGRPFVAAADVGIFYDPDEPPVVPDVFVSLDVEAADDMWEKKNRSYFLSVFGKPPEIAIEIVSNKKGGEAGKKFGIYAQTGVRYYVIFDPQKLIQKESLRIYELYGGQYIPKVDRNLTQAGLGLTLWEGGYENKHNTWLRWTDSEGSLVLSGREKSQTERKRAQAERKRADTERKRADTERKRADTERRRAEQAEKQLISERKETARNLVSMGILSPEQISQATGLSLKEVEILGRET